MNELLQEISSHYGLGYCAIKNQHIHWGSHIRWHVQTAERGDLFIKESPPFLSDTEFFLHIRCQLFVQKFDDFIVPLIMDGENSPVFRWKNRIMTLHPWIDSRPVSFETDFEIEQIAEISARFLARTKHWASEKGTRSFNYPTRRPTFCPETWDEIYRFTYLIDKALDRQSLNKTKKVDYFRNWIKENSGKVSDIIIDGLSQQFIHGDMQRFNMLADNSNKYYLIDFDRIHWSYRLCEIASLAVLIGAVHSPEDSTRIYILERWEWDKIFTFIETFSLVNPLTFQERKLMIVFLGMFLIRNFIGGFDLDYDNNSIENDFVAQIDKTISLLEQINDGPY